MTSKDKLNFISNFIDSSRCDLMQIDLYKKEIEKDLEVLEIIKKHYRMNIFEELIVVLYVDVNDTNILREWLNNDK